jgi:dihydroorotase
VILKNATWLTPQGDFRAGTILVRRGVIERLGASGPLSMDSEEAVDCSGRLVLPGLIDSHVHFREPGQAYKEGIANGSLAAAVGGVTTVLDMPNNRPPCSTDELLRRKKKLFRSKCLTNWGLHTEATDHPPYVTDTAVASAKVYMARSSSNPALYTTSSLTRVFEQYHRVSIHAEDETAFLPGSSGPPPSARRRSDDGATTGEEENRGKMTPFLHHEIRPRRAVVSALEKIEKAYESLREENRPRLVLCHIATVEELQWVRSMKDRGHDIYAETCPHYWTFTEQDYVERGSLLKVNPPLRTAADRRAILHALCDGGIDFVSTDHAPHTRAEKADSTSPPSGIAGIEWVTPLLLRLVDEGVISWRRFVQLGCETAARCYEIIGRDGIRVGNAGDFVLVEKTPPAPSPSRAPVTKAGVNPYGEKRFGYRVFATMVNGTMVQQGGAILNRGVGEEVYQ